MIVNCFVTLTSLQVAVIAYQQTDYTLQFERAEASISDDSAFRGLHIRTFKYNRTITAINISMEMLRDLGNEANINFQAYKLASNEYRLFPITFKRNVCEMLKKDEFGLSNLYNCGRMFKCPMKNGNYSTCNWMPDYSKSPPYIPIGSYKLELIGTHQNVELGRLYLYATVKRPIPIG